MQRQPNRIFIGMFTIFGVFIFGSIIMMFVGDKIIKSEQDELVMYFDESIKGLNVGSPVLFRGVEIGKVSYIDLIADASDLNFSVPVYIRLSKDQNFRLKNDRKIRHKELFIKNLVKSGLRAKLVTQSYLTGQLSIELEFLQNAPIVFKTTNLPSNIIEIPTVLSPFGELSKGLQDWPIKTIIDKINNILDVMNKNLPIILNQTSSISSNINDIILNNKENISTTLWNLNKTLDEINDAAKALKNFADYIERNPEALLKGNR
jgi:paraquat-inducible protein B